MARIISHYGLLQSAAMIIYFTLIAQKFLISIVHEYLHGAVFLCLHYSKDQLH